MQTVAVYVLMKTSKKICCKLHALGVESIFLKYKNLLKLTLMALCLVLSVYLEGV